MRERINKANRSARNDENKSRPFKQDFSKPESSYRSAGYGDKKPFVKREGESFRSDRRDFGDKKPFVKREGEGFRSDRRDFGDKKPFVKREGEGFRSERPNGGRRDFGDKKPFVKREGEGFRSDRRDFGDKKPFVKREGEGFRSERPNGDRRDFGDKKPFVKREGEGFRSERPNGDRRDFGDKKPFVKREGEGFRSERPNGDRRDFGDKKPFVKREGEGFRSERPNGDRRDFGDKKPFVKREGEGFRSERPNSDRRDFGDKKPFVKREGEGFRSERPNSDRRDFGDKKPFVKREGEGFRSERPNGDRRDFGDKKPFVKREGGDSFREGRESNSVPSYDNVRPPFKKKGSSEQTSLYNETEIRLNRYISNSGLCSRRDADELIAAGQITVNNEVITEMGYKVKPTDIVKYGKRALNPEKPVYLLLNKPKDYITTTDDPQERKTVMDLVKDSCPQRIYPVGRLDRNTSGLLLFTNDGELADKLMHPSHTIEKVYQLLLDLPLKQEHFQQILEGIELEDGVIQADELAIISPDRLEIGIRVHSGKNRIVRRIFEHFGYQVVKLDRTVYAGLNKKDITRGQWRFLTEKEVIRLKYML